LVPNVGRSVVPRRFVSPQGSVEFVEVAAGAGEGGVSALEEQGTEMIIAAAAMATFILARTIESRFRKKRSERVENPASINA
jgi:NAD(P)-dependent dehydrogenase (short-subunit alcohol dehydrogenase family)